MPCVDRPLMFLLVLSCLLPCGCGREDRQASPEETAGTISSPWLPGAGDIAGWEPADKAALFAGRDLFVYINGGAEIYHEYGFERVVVQDFRNAAGNRINVEVFEMESDRGAFGIYSFKRGRGGESLLLGNGGMLKDYYINFWKGRIAVTVTGLDDGPEILAGLRSVARAVDDRLPAGGETPDLVAFLGRDGLIGNSECYMMGGLGLYNGDSFFARNVFSCDEAVKGDFARGRTAFLLRYAGAAEAAGRFGAAEQTLRSDDGFSAFVREGKTISMRDRAGRFIITRLGGSCVAVVIAAAASGEAVPGVATSLSEEVALACELLRGAGGAGSCAEDGADSE